MSPTQAIMQNPMNWKDYVTAIGLLLTLSTVAIQGGRILERLDGHAKVQESLLKDLTETKIDVARLQGADLLHEERYNVLKSRVDKIAEQKGEK